VFIAVVNRCATQKQNQKQNQVQMQKPWRTLRWNPTLAQKMRKDGAPIGQKNRGPQKAKPPEFFSSL
jgi:hypothetical protein